MSNILTRIMNFMWLGGPIFTKELIVSSKRRRNYLVRFVYPAALAFFVAAIWDVIKFNGPSTNIFIVARMAQLGSHITTVIVWFQFIVIQALAVIMLSTAISDEIYHKTLGILMTTPIGGFQIVLSKLLSKLLQLFLLVAISLPVLAIIRVFGGVPWRYVLSSLCITLTAAVFAGSLSLLFSIYNRQSHLVVTRTALTCFIIYAIPLLAFNILQQLGYTFYSNLFPQSGLFFINPFLHMLKMSPDLGSVISLNMGPWGWHCIAMLGLSLAVLTWSGFNVRKVGLRQVTGQAGMYLTRKERKLAEKKQALSYSSISVSKKIRDIKWPPVIWREIADPLIKSSRITFIFSVVLAIIFLTIAYGLCIYLGAMKERTTQIGFVLTYFFIGLIRTSTFASTSITSEKEARTWPILLTSPLAEKEIVFGKIIGSSLRAWPYWLLLAVHLIVFIVLGAISIFVVIPLVLLAISSSLLVAALGVMFSSVCKRNSTSSSLNMLVFLLFVIPVCCVPLYLASPLFAVISIFINFGGYGDLMGFTNNPVYSSFESVFMWFLFSQLSFIIFVIVYLLVTFAMYKISVNSIRWRIL
jgi:ABC-2 type transport system permease protein